MDNGFSRACPSGNHMIDRVEEHDGVFLCDLDDVKNYADIMYPGDPMAYRAMLKEFGRQGYLKVRG